MKYSDSRKIYLYSHWKGGEEDEGQLIDDLRRALRRKQRWNDESYLARIIISEVIKDDIEGETGYGIAPYVGEEEFKTIEVDFEKQTVDGMSFEEFIQ